MNVKLQISSSKSQRISKQQAPKQPVPMKSKRHILLFALFVALGGLTWLLLPPRDPLFHGRPESEWIKSIEYNGDDRQTKQWRELGPAGVHVLIRGLDNANHPLERTYRKKDPNDQIAYRAAQLLGEMRQEPALAVPPLIESLENTDTLVASTAAQALVKFKEQAEIIIPALEKAAQRTDSTGGPARWALKQTESQAAANRGAPK